MARTKPETKPETKPRMKLEMKPRTKIILASLTIILSFFIDQYHKFYMIQVSGLIKTLKIEVLPFFDWVLVWNRGVSYGLFQVNTATGTYILASITSVVIILLFYMLYKSIGKLSCFALSLVIGGALSNLADRFHYGAVPDFFSFYIDDYRWYVFNTADIFITVGIVLLFIENFFFQHNNDLTNEETEATEKNKTSKQNKIDKTNKQK